MFLAALAGAMSRRSMRGGAGEDDPEEDLDDFEFNEGLSNLFADGVMEGIPEGDGDIDMTGDGDMEEIPEGDGDIDMTGDGDIDMTGDGTWLGTQ